MGFGFQTIASTQAVPFWQALVNANKFGEPLFSFYLTRFGNVNNAADLEPGGVLTLGGTNSSLFQGDIDFVNMPSDATPSFWLLDMTSLYSSFSQYYKLEYNVEIGTMKNTD